MKQNENKIHRIDVDKAWDTLYTRLEKEHLLTDETTAYLSHRKRRIFLQQVAAVAAICAGVIFTIFYFSRSDGQSLLSMQNKENSGTLVATLEDGSTVYLASGASISYPAAFAKDQRKVKLNGNALFYVTKNAKRPFVVEANGMTIEVVGTIFAVQSSPGSPFELSVKEGKVNVHSKNDQTPIPVNAGESVQLNKNGLCKSEIKNSLIFSRFTDKMCFKDEKLNNIVHAINTVYGSPAIIADKSLNNRTLTVTFENDSIEAMTELICMALNLEQINKQDTIFIRKF